MANSQSGIGLCNGSGLALHFIAENLTTFRNLSVSAHLAFTKLTARS